MSLYVVRRSCTNTMLSIVILLSTFTPHALSHLLLTLFLCCHFLSLPPPYVPSWHALCALLRPISSLTPYISPSFSISLLTALSTCLHIFLTQFPPTPLPQSLTSYLHLSLPSSLSPSLPSVCLNQHMLGPQERLLAFCDKNKDLYLALLAGSPGPSRWRKLCQIWLLS